VYVQILRETLYPHKIDPPVSDRPSDLSGGAYFFHISCNSNPGRMSVYRVPSLISNCLRHFSSVGALLVRVTRGLSPDAQSQFRGPRLAPNF